MKREFIVGRIFFLQHPSVTSFPSPRVAMASLAYLGLLGLKF